MYKFEEKYLTATPIEDCCKYVKDNFNEIYPFEITCGYNFQIRMNKSTYKELPEKLKSSLKEFAYIGEQRVDDTVWNHYLKDFFWITTNEYIFTFVIKTALQLETKCIYGPETVEESDKTIVFIDSKSLPTFILLNIDLESRNAPKYPDVTTKISSK